MPVKGFLIKYNYLLRFVLSLFVALCIPLLIFAFTILQHSYGEMIKRNEDYYRNTTASFVAYFDEQLSVMKDHALTIAFDNAQGYNKITKETIESHPYYYLMAAKTLADYKIGLPNTTDIGLHFQGTDYIITSGFKYTISDFLRAYSGTSSEQMQAMTGFFTGDGNKTSMLSTFQYNYYKDAKLFIGIPVTMNNQHKALIFYILKSDSISTSFFGTQSSGQLQLCMFDYDGSLVYTNKPLATELIGNEEFTRFIRSSDSTIFKYSNNENSYTVFKAPNAKLGKIFVSIVPQDQVEKSYRQFYNVMRNNTILIAAFFLLLLALTAYINYKPILTLVRRIINMHSNIGINSEIKTIACAFDQMEEFVSEQKIILMDYFLANFLYGIPIPQADAERLDIKLHGGLFCVLTISDLKLDTSGREQLAEVISLKCDIHAYITDVLYKDHMVLICVLKDEDVSKLVQEVKQYLFSHYGISYRIGVGHVVKHLDDIQKSYMNALHSTESTTVNLAAPNTEISIIQDYPSDEIMLLLYYVQNGEKDNALKTLSSIVQYISSEIDTMLLQRYICYDILISYIKCLKQIKYPLGSKETGDLLAHTNIDDLYHSLSDSIRLVCESIAYNNNKMYDSLQKEIIEYINGNFTDSNICRTQVADKFGISIYSLSRIFKDSIGIGFKEYITGKRMELSRQLLLTTDKSIVQITADVGFDDPDYFSKLFKANYGLSPSKFRSQ